MEKKTRTFLFIVCVFLFLFFSTSIILYIQGYRFDFENKKLTKTGGLFLKALPKQASIYLNNKFYKKTDFIFGSTLIQNLLPKKYKVKIEKEGYFPWEKTLEVKENSVTEAKYIILFPKNLESKILFKEIENLWHSPSQKKMILLSKEKILSIYDLEKKESKTLIQIPKENFQITDLSFSDDEKKVYLKVKIDEEIKNLYLNLEEPSPELKEEKGEKENERLAIYKTGDSYYYLTKEGFIFKTDLNFSFKTQINRKPFPIEKENYEIIVVEDWIFLKEEDRIFSFNKEEDSFEKIFDNVSGYKISKNNEKMAIFSNNEIWVLYLKDRVIQPPKKKGEKVFIARFSEKIGNLFWLNLDYLIFNAGGKIKICDIDDRDFFNIYDLKEFENPKIFFNETEKNLYILDKEILYSLNFPFL